MYPARSVGSLGLGDSSDVFFARTHELLQYHFRTVALAFEYDKEASGGVPILGEGRPSRRPSSKNPSLLGCPKNPGVVLSSEEAREPRESVDCSFGVFTLGGLERCP